jgi:hypothetical protein
LFRNFLLIRRAVAIVCMALAAVLSAQTFISVMDRIEHAHHHAHFPNALAGDMQFCGGEHDPCEGHQHGATNKVAPHYGDAVIVFLPAQSFVLVACALPRERCASPPTAFTSVSPRGPDHPPKSILEVRV